MTYKEAMEYIGSRLRFGIKPGLERIRRLLSSLDEPQDDLRFIHVAGTNGKGSVCTMTASALTASGLKTGLYTSPYVTRFSERMQIDGRQIDDASLAELTERVARVVGEDDPVTEFELITAVAMLWYAREKCDRVVLETGLGGRFDATNVIAAPDCSVITRIDYDHTAILGDTLDKIAFEKAGIIKPGCPVVVSPVQEPEALDTLKKAADERGCRFILPDLRAVRAGEPTLGGTDIVYDGLPLHIPLAGRHQIVNTVTAVEALRAVGTAEEHIAAGVARARIPARLEVLSEKPSVILDGAHNPNGAAALADAIDTLLAGRRVVAVMGVLRDKDYNRELELLGGRMSRIFTCGGFSERALDAESFAQTVSRYTDAVAMPSPKAALEAALSEADENTAVVICGSLYLAGAIRADALKMLGREELI